MESKISRIVEKLSYIKSCICDRDVLVFESVKLSKAVLQEMFEKDNQKLLNMLLDTTYSLGRFPLDGTIVMKVNFLSQLLFELDFFSSPSSLQSLRMTEAAEWNSSDYFEKTNMLRLPRLYKQYESVYYLHLLRDVTPFLVDPITVISTCCDSFSYVLDSFHSVQFTPSEKMCFEDVLKSVMTLIIKPIVEALTMTCNQIVTQSFEECFEPTIVS